MIDLTDALKGERASLLPRPPIRETPPRKAFTMRGLRRTAVWGATAGAALFLAILASRSDVALERVALLLHRQSAHSAPTPFDAQAATDRLARQVQGLARNDDALSSRLATLEQNMTDITGSVSKQLAASSETRRDEAGPSLFATATATAAMPPPTVIDAPDNALPPLVPIEASTQTARPAASAEYGVDIGSGLTLQALRMRWMAMRAAHVKLFERLEPVISVREIPHTNRIELRLVAGPFPQPGGATEFCAALVRAGQFCQPTVYEGQHLALR